MKQVVYLAYKQVRYPHKLYIIGSGIKNGGVLLILEICPTPRGGMGGKNVIFSKSKVAYHVKLQPQKYHHRVYRTQEPPTTQNFTIVEFATGVRGGGGGGQSCSKYGM